MLHHLITAVHHLTFHFWIEFRENKENYLWRITWHTIAPDWGQICYAMQSWWVIVVHRVGQSLHFHTTLFLGFKLWITERSQCRLVGGFQNRENLPVGVLFWSARKISGLWWWLVGMFLNWGFLPVLVLVAQQVLPLLCLSSTSSPSPHFLPPQMQQSSPKRSHTVTKRLNFALNNRSDGWESNCCTTGHWTPP